MRFREYTTFRALMARHGDEPQKAYARKVSSHEFRKSVVEWFGTQADMKDPDEFNQGSLALAEEAWAAQDRPYYNVWPIVVSLAPSVKLNLRFSQVQVKFHAILLRFAQGHEPHHLGTALLFWPKGMKTIQVFCHFFDGADTLLTVQHAYEAENTVEEWLANLEQRGSQLSDHQHAAGLLLVRLVVFIGLLSRDEDLITPIVLGKDRAKYESTNDEEVKRWLEERAARRAGRGFDVGKRLELAKDKSPHWRNPHLCLTRPWAATKKPKIRTPVQNQFTRARCGGKLHFAYTTEQDARTARRSYTVRLYSGLGKGALDPLSKCEVGRLCKA